MKKLVYNCFLLCLFVISLLGPKAASAHFKPVNLACVAANPRFSLPVQQFFQATAASDLQDDPTHLSMLIGVAVRQRYGSSVRAREIARLMSTPHPGQIHNFLDIKKVLQKAGYRASAYRVNPANRLLPRLDDVGFLLDQKVVADRSIITLLFAATQDKKYLLYADGIICAMPVPQFEQRFGNSVFLRLD